MTDDLERVTELLGRDPRCEFEVVVRREDGGPMVIRNTPLLDDGTPMPTRYWLVDPQIRSAIGTLESAGGVRHAEAAVSADDLAAAHARYAAERDAHVPTGYDGPRPSGGVGGTRQGVKCLHAHYAWFLAGGDDPVGRWVEDRLNDVEDSGPTSSGGDGVTGRLASIDCGSNSTRLLVVEAEGPVTVDRQMSITRLGQGVGETGAMESAAIARTLAVLRQYRDVMDDHGVDRVRMTATSAARDSTNRDELFDAAEKIVGTRPELLTGEQEARLSFRGATADLDHADGPFLVVDIGGGSTEFAVGTDECEWAMSVDVGCVRLTEAYLDHDPPLPEELVACLSLTDTYIEDVVRAIPAAHDVKTFVGLAGTISTVAAVEQGLAEYDRNRIHHFRLTREAAEDVFRTLATESLEDRRHNPGLEPERADVIVGGCCVLQAIMRHFQFDSCLVSEADILDGLVLSLLDP